MNALAMVLFSFWSPACALGQASPASRPAVEPIAVSRGEPQLFVDDRLIGEQSDLQRTLHMPQKENAGRVPVITMPGEATLLAKGTILRDPRLGAYVMFAKGFSSKQIYRFTSSDGLAWSDPAASRPIQIDLRHPVTGKIMDRQYGGMHSFHYDAEDAEHPYKGWMFMGNWGDEHEGVYFIRSADGIAWERGPLVVQSYAGPGDPSCRVIHQDGRVVYGPGDTTRFSYDPASGRFLGIFKFFTTEAVPPENQLRSRAYAFLDRLDRPFDVHTIDRVDLLPPVATLNGDQPGDEYYASTAWRYGSVWLGGLLVWHRTGDYPHSAAGCAFLKLLVSRDGLHWRKVPFRNDAGTPEVFIPNGSEGGNDGHNDGGYMSEFSQGPLRIDDELVYYYGCSSFGKNHAKGVAVSGGGIFRARLRLDGFVSVDGGMLTTPPLRLEGGQVRVNGVGPIRLEVLDDRGSVLARSLIRGDSVRHPVEFQGTPSDQLVGAGSVRLRWQVDKGGRLYSFTAE